MPKKYNLRKTKPDPESDSESSSSSSYDSSCSDSDDSTYIYESSESSTPKKSKKSNNNKKPKRNVSDQDLQKVLAELFPSNANKKSKPTKNKKQSKKYESESDEDSGYETVTDESSIWTDDCKSEEESEYENNDDKEDENTADEQEFQITLTIGAEKPQKTSDNDDELNSEDEKTFMREAFDETLTNKDSPKNKQKRAKKPEPEFDDVDIESKYKEIVELKKVLYEKHKNNPKNKIIKKALEQCDQKVKKLIKNARSKNAKTFEDLLDRNDMQENTDEIGYFKKRLSNKEQLQIMKDLRSLNTQMCVEKPYRLSVLQSSLPVNVKMMALQRLNQLAMMEPGEPEYYKLRNWVDGFMRIPFGKQKNISISIADGIEKCNDFVVNAKQQLDACVYGLNDAKMQIMQMVGQWISNPSSMGTAIAVKGAPGTGKTSLIKDGVSKILGREFAFIALGGCGDSSYLEGHSYTYEGSTYGKIVQILMDCKCMNPVIYFDELDKVSDSSRGQEIIGLLTHLTDTTQNSQFRDKYFSEIDFDLSKCLFIFSYNDENLVNPILKDRMYKIETKGYDLKEKQIIARNYMLPKIREQVGFQEGDIVITDDVLAHIISNQAKGEAGVRNLKRCLEIIHTKLNLYRLVKTGTQLFEKEMGLQVSFPYTLTKRDVDILVKSDETMSQSVLCSMYV